MMTTLNRQLVLGLVMGLLVAVAARGSRAALTVGNVGLGVGYADGVSDIGNLPGRAPEVLKCCESSESPALRFSTGNTGELAPLFSASSSSPLPAHEQTKPPSNGNHRNSQQPNEVLFSVSQTFPGSSTSGTSASTSGTSTFPIDSAAVVSLPEAELVAWVDGEQRFALPMPPGNELLRPPRGRYY